MSFIWTSRADGSNLRRLARGTEPAFSPDGRKIVYVGSRGRPRTINAGGGSSHRVPLWHGLWEDEDLQSPDWQPLPR